MVVRAKYPCVIFDDNQNKIDLQEGDRVNIPLDKLEQVNAIDEISTEHLIVELMQRMEHSIFMGQQKIGNKLKRHYRAIGDPEKCIGMCHFAQDTLSRVLRGEE